MSDEILTRLERLTKLKNEGVLTEEEFEKRKASIIDPNPSPKTATNWIKWLIGPIVLVLFAVLINKCQ